MIDKEFIEKHKLDEWEIQFLEDIEAGKYRPIPRKEFYAMREGLAIAAARTLERLRDERMKKDKKISIRVNSHDLTDIKILAAKAKVKYQTYITNILHDVATGKLKPKA